MFIHDTHLPQILEPECYYSTESHQREKERLFEPAWHYVGTMHELPQDGSFLTRTVLDKSILFWRVGDEVRAFANVCPHRFSMLTQKPCGKLERLKCQYHGWEFDNNGDTCLIPDAPSFRPLRKGELGLLRFRT